MSSENNNETHVNNAAAGEQNSSLNHAQQPRPIASRDRSAAELVGVSVSNKDSSDRTGGDAISRSVSTGDESALDGEIISHHSVDSAATGPIEPLSSADDAATKQNLLLAVRQAPVSATVVAELPAASSSGHERHQPLQTETPTQIQFAASAGQTSARDMTLQQSISDQHQQPTSSSTRQHADNLQRLPPLAIQPVTQQPLPVENPTQEHRQQPSLSPQQGKKQVLQQKGRFVIQPHDPALDMGNTVQVQHSQQQQYQPQPQQQNISQGNFQQPAMSQQYSHDFSQQLASSQQYSQTASQQPMSNQQQQQAAPNPHHYLQQSPNPQQSIVVQQHNHSVPQEQQQFGQPPPPLYSVSPPQSHSGNSSSPPQSNLTANPAQQQQQQHHQSVPQQIVHPQLAPQPQATLQGPATGISAPVVVTKKKGRFNIIEQTAVPPPPAAESTESVAERSVTNVAHLSNASQPVSAPSSQASTPKPPVAKKKGRFVVTNVSLPVQAVASMTSPDVVPVEQSQIPMDAQQQTSYGVPVQGPTALAMTAVPETTQQQPVYATNPVPTQANMTTKVPKESTGQQTMTMMAPAQQAFYPAQQQDNATGSIQNAQAAFPMQQQQQHKLPTSTAFPPTGMSVLLPQSGVPPQRLSPIPTNNNAPSGAESPMIKHPHAPTVAQRVLPESSSTEEPVPMISEKNAAAEKINAVPRVTKPTPVRHITPGQAGYQGFGKISYYLDQMRSEVNDADRMNKRLLTDMKCLVR